MSAAELERDGVTAIPQLLSPAQVEASLAALHRLFEHGVFDGDKGELIMHTPNLTARDQVFRDVVQLPRVVELLAGVLGDDYILADMVSLTPAPGNEAQNLHRDAGNVDFPIMVNCMVALVDFDGANGATRCALDPPFPAAHPPSSPAPPRPSIQGSG